MGLFKLPGRFSGRPVVEDDTAPRDFENTEDNKELDAANAADSGSEPEDLSTEYQRGDEAIRAMTQVWSRKHLTIAYILYVPNPLSRSNLSAKPTNTA